MKRDFEILPHTADIKIRVYGKTKKDLFRNAVAGMFQAIRPIVSECDEVDDRIVCPELSEHHQIETEASDEKSLLVDFLSDALYLSDVYNEAYFDATIDELSERHIKATVHGVQVTGFEVVEIKAVTYHELDIKQVDDCWQADIVFDI